MINAFKERDTSKSIYSLSFLIIIFLSLFCSFTQLSFGDEPQHLRQSIRALGMGNSFTAAVNDESALFYNPAGLKSLQQHIFEIATVDLTMSQNYFDLAEEDTDDQAAFIGELIGKKLYAEVNSEVFSISGPGWGYAVFGGALADITIHNPTVPFLDITAYVQKGVICGLAFDFLDETLDIGFNVKLIERNGIQKVIYISDYLDEDFEDNLRDEMKTESSYSPDIGFIYHLNRFYNLQTKLGFVVRNIGSMEFGSSGELPMTMDIGIATESELAGFDIIMAVDYVDLTSETTEETSYQRNLKMGMEIGAFKRSNGHHALSVRFGSNGPYFTYGLTLNPPFLPLKLDYASWSQEVGTVAGDVEDKRHSVQIAINF